MVDIFIPLVVGLLLIFSPQLFVKRANADFQKKKTMMKKIGIVLIIVAAIYLIGKLAASQSKKEELVKQIVESAKSQTNLPAELDSTTTMTDIIAVPGAIRYQYVLHDADTSSFSNATFRNLIISKLCKDESSKNILNEGINIEFSYAVKDSQQTYFTSFTKANCSAY